MRLYLIRLIFSACICLSCSAAFAQTRYQITEIPDEVPAQYLTRDGQILGLDRTSGNAVLWNAESGITTIPAPHGNKWSSVAASPGGRFLGAAFTPDYNTEVYYEGQLGSDLSPVSWPTSLTGVGSQGGTSAGIIAGGTICWGPCPPEVRPPSYVPQPPRYLANAINDDGVISGSVYIDRNSGPVIQLGLGDVYAFRLYPNGQIDMMEGLEAASINSRGDALLKPVFKLGSQPLPLLCGAEDNTLLWTFEGQLLTPDPLSGYTKLVRPVLDNRGEIAGTATNEGQNLLTGNPASGNVQGFLWTPGSGTIALDLLPRFISSIVHGLNNTGSAVGEAINANTVSGTCGGPITIFDPTQPAPTRPSTAAVIWGHDGHVVDLNTVIKKKYEQHVSAVELLTGAFAINDAGQILAAGVDKSGGIHHYLLSPRPDKGSGAGDRHRHEDHDDSTDREDRER